ncbi:MAG: NapC/NirT family cytochrome c [Bacteroidales bacterium]|nr:NapC/NirT family cytochrome c [Bacteroidales bacterium]
MKLPRSVYNWTSVIGLTIAIISLFMIGFLFVISMFLDQGGSYLGLFTFIILPVFLIVGLLMIPVGMWITVKRNKKIDLLHGLSWPIVDLNDLHHRNAFAIFVVGSVFLLLVSAVGSYEAFHYTESVEFCGKLCHQVMEPEYVAYANSSHARVSCVECHVGAGADWYVRSKLSGLRQVHATLTNSYPTPIPTPVHDLRPAQETCEQCHWPEKFYPNQNRFERHYLADEQNSEWDIGLQMKVGPQFSALGLQAGIHWHINPDVKIEYKSVNNKRDTIPWVKYTNLKTGESQIFKSLESDFADINMDAIQSRTMDCMDCHNRPSHDYLSPVKFVDHALTSGRLPKTLPDLKVIAMEILVTDYPTKDSAMSDIATRITEYYQVMYPELLDTNKILIDQTIQVLREEFNKNIFPEMGVKWKAYPNHLGHIESNGCFRCHDQKHVSNQGEVISRNCTLCHNISAQGAPDSLEVALSFESLEFTHPINIKGKWKELLCSECHADLY